MFSSLFSKIGIAGILVAGGLLFSLPADAAVPVAVTQFDAGTDFEQSVLTFLGELLDLLGQKQLEATAAFELLKIEKAREDTNKLFQEVLEELTDYGLILTTTGDVRLTNDPRCLEKPGLCTEPAPVISPYKEGRMINNVYDYIFEEPRERARVYTMCFFNMLIWDQAGYIDNVFDATRVTVPPKRNALTAQRLKRECQMDATTDANYAKCTYGQSTLASVNNLRFARDGLLFSLSRSFKYHTDYPQIFLFGDWAGFPDADPPNQRYGLKGRGEDDMSGLREQSFKNCVPVLAGGGITPPLVPDPNFPFHNILPEEIIGFLPLLDQSTVNRHNVSFYELRLSKNDKEGIDGIVRIASSIINIIVAETSKERELTYLAGQGIRPERLYQEVSVPLKDLPPEVVPASGAFILSATEGKLTYQFDTGYIISPAVVLLQKMQAANQAMFDLAQKAFLYLDAEDVSIQTQRRYGVWSNAENCFDDEGKVVSCPSLFGAFERQICNTAAPDPDADPPITQTCLWLRPWLKPNVGFLSAPDKKHIGPGRKSSKFGPVPIISATGGLPAPWEDTNTTLSLGNEKVGGDKGYTVADYRWPAGAVFGFPPGSEKGDNIGSKILGADFSINDWYDRVFEMYESQRLSNVFQFDTRDWSCYLATWFAPTGYQGLVLKGQGPLHTPVEIYTKGSYEQGKPSVFAVAMSTTGDPVPGGKEFSFAKENLIKKYCQYRLDDRSY